MQEVFTSHLLLEALSLLSKLDKGSSLVEEKRLVQDIERLLALHFTLPLRDSFMSKYPKNQKSDNSEERVSFLYQELNSRLGNSAELLNVHFLPLLLDEVSRAVPRSTFKQRVEEASWLETAFVTFAARAGCCLSSNPIWDAVPRDVSVLVDLLQVTIDRKIGVSLETLIQFTVKYAGLIHNQTVQWQLMAKILAINPDVFLPNSGLQRSRALLDDLISKISSVCSQENATEEEYSTIKSSIVLPLIRAFSAARDLDTFVEMWSSRLESIGDGHLKGNGSSFSVWEDDDVLETYAILVQSTLAAHMTEQIYGRLSRLPSELGSGYSHVVWLDAISDSTVYKNDDEGFRQFEEAIGAVIRLLASKSLPIQWKWRLWRVAARLTHNFTAASDYVSVDITSKLLSMAVDALERFHSQKCASLPASEYLVAFQSFSFLVTVAGKAESTKLAEDFNNVIPKVMPYVHEAAQGSSSWTGRVDDLASAPHLALAYLALLIAFPAAVAQMTPGNRQLLFGRLFASFDQNARVDERSSQFQDAWAAMVSPEWLMQVPSSVHDLVDILHQSLQTCKALSPLAVSSLLTIPTQLISRHQRVMLLDLLLQLTVQRESTDMSTFTAADALVLMARLAEASKATSARITNEPDALWDLARAVCLDRGGEATRLLTAFSKLHQAVFRRVLVSSDGHRQEYLYTLWQRVSHVAAKGKTAKFETLEFLMLAESIKALGENVEYLDGIIDRESLMSVETKVKTTILEALDSARHRVKKGKNLDSRVMVGNLFCLDELGRQVWNDKASRKTVKKIKESVDAADVVVLVKRSLILTSKLKPDEDTEALLLDCLSSFSPNSLQAAEEQQLIHDIHARLFALSPKKLTSLIFLIENSLATADANSPHRFLIAGVALTCLSSTPIEERDSAESRTLTAFFSRVCDELPRCRWPAEFAFATECLDMMLRTQVRSVRQWCVDDMLGMLGVVVSPEGLAGWRGSQANGEASNAEKMDAQMASGNWGGPRQAGMVYTRVCRLLGILIGQYRQKLSGRMHLVVMLLQRLLRCLFVYDVTTTALPPWLRTDDDSYFGRPSAVAADPVYAQQYSRLLGSLCDPTVSSVQRPAAATGGDSAAALTDNTKKVRSLAGQHLQYVVMEFAKSALRGRLEPATKAALEPGLFGVLDVISRETRRAMNSAMAGDAGAQAVFRRLYEDYVRFGRWDHG